MDHYGLTGQIKDDVIGKVHNRTVVTTFDAYGRSSVKHRELKTQLWQRQQRSRRA
jgi:hypothetical protein